MKKYIIICLGLFILYFCLHITVQAQNPSDLPLWETRVREQNAKLRENLLQQLDTLKQKEVGFYDSFVRNCTPATLTTLGTARILGLQDGICSYSKTVNKTTLECKIPQGELGEFVDESINIVETGVESQRFYDIVDKYCAVK